MLDGDDGRHEDHRAGRGLPASWAGRSRIRARRRCIISGSTSTASTASTCRWRCAPDRLEQALRALPALGFRGCNLTIPHKQAALAIVDRVEPVARRIGAINTIVVAADGSLEGAQHRCLRLSRESARKRAGLGPASGSGGRARRRRRGAGRRGGADRGGGRGDPAGQPHRRRAPSAGPGSRRRPCAGSPCIDWEARGRRAARRAGSWSTRPASAWTGEPPLDLDLGGLPAAAVVVDIVYVPLETGLLAAARAARPPRPSMGSACCCTRAGPGSRRGSARRCG